MDEGSRGPEIAVSMPCEAWRTALAGAEEMCRRVAAAALGAGGAGWPLERAEVSLVLADDATVQILNRDYRGKDAPTNVLSFAALDGEAPPAEGPVLLGDVILAYETTAAEALRDGKTMMQHTAHLVVHGVLHLLGYDHEEDPEALRMEALETAILGALGVDDPYGPTTEFDDLR